MAQDLLSQVGISWPLHHTWQHLVSAFLSMCCSNTIISAANFVAIRNPNRMCRCSLLGKSLIFKHHVLRRLLIFTRLAKPIEIRHFNPHRPSESSAATSNHLMFFDFKELYCRAPFKPSLFLILKIAATWLVASLQAILLRQEYLHRSSCKLLYT